MGDQCKETFKGSSHPSSLRKRPKGQPGSNGDRRCVKKGAHAGNLIKSVAPLVGGGGGGRPSMAQAGGKNPAGMAEAMEKAEEILRSQLKDL
ncbi:hypothetical protein FYJ34_12540 [Clostridiaceae bacterium 68-1-5]|uniref:Alanine--tRNA ligase n=1 Tax=Suipraeoptans intestinalis TaxID=2606628 RepID=A0A6N7UTN7_9FIRM|nr:hypothetical protein [Suipraeoptans intestinalis]